MILSNLNAVFYLFTNPIPIIGPAFFIKGRKNKNYSNSNNCKKWKSDRKVISFVLMCSSISHVLQKSQKPHQSTLFNSQFSILKSQFLTTLLPYYLNTLLPHYPTTMLPYYHTANCHCHCQLPLPTATANRHCQPPLPTDHCPLPTAHGKLIKTPTLLTARQSLSLHFSKYEAETCSIT